MALDTKAALQQMDAVLNEARNVRQEMRSVHTVRQRSAWIEHEDGGERQYALPNDEDLSRANVLILSVLKRFARPGSPYVEQAEAVVKKSGLSNNYTREQLIGMLRALRYEYETGGLLSVSELVHADLFADFLEMARHQLEKGFKDPAAVLAAGVLEQHLKRLAERYQVPILKPNGEPKKTETINEELTKTGAYEMATQKEVTAKLALRNDAAHGDWGKYQPQQVSLFIDWVSFFMQKYPA